ncbi:hypothetical protein SAMN05920897_11956 [Alkalispirochaeta americana]|uniref:Uncharacterized protein n=1 Tax=Alkalispirochaeta americana TaxID=159291 RepID=A0A1N6X012_9SPIO|nr:hypothetical protein [Alkalispirochaeta americana]SIQ95657.1 hypothetical protein SAMN05920897_11956 [Alkalispirochaeta americana]
MKHVPMVIDELREDVRRLYYTFLKEMDHRLYGRMKSIRREDIAREVAGYERVHCEAMSSRALEEFEQELAKLDRSELEQLKETYLGHYTELGLSSGTALNRPRRMIGDMIAAEAHEALRRILQVVWVHGDQTARRGIMDYYDGKAEIRFDLDPTEGALGKTTREQGVRIFHLHRDFATAHSDAGIYEAALILSHELHRTGTGENRKQKTREAVESDIAMAGKVRNSYRRLPGRNHRLMEFLQGVEKIRGKRSLHAIVDKLFSSQAEYWLLTTDGNIEWGDDTGSKRDLHVQHYLPDTNEGARSIRRAHIEDETGSISQALARYVGLQRAEELLGRSLHDLRIYDDQTLIDVLELADEAGVNSHRVLWDQRVLPHPFMWASFTEDQREKLAGEAMMKHHGMEWNGNAWIDHDEISLPMSDVEDLGQIVINEDENGNIARFAIQGLVMRDRSSHDSLRTHTARRGDPNREAREADEHLQGLDSIILTKHDLDGNEIGRYRTDGWQTVANGYNASLPEGARAYINTEVYRKSTIATNHPFYMRFGGFNSSQWDGPYFEINRAKTIGGTEIGADAGRNGNDDPRWLGHSDRTNSNTWSDGLISAGCFINTPTVLAELDDQITDWGVDYPYDVRTVIREE